MIRNPPKSSLSDEYSVFPPVESKCPEILPPIKWKIKLQFLLLPLLPKLYIKRNSRKRPLFYFSDFCIAIFEYYDFFNIFNFQKSEKNAIRFLLKYFQIFTILQRDICMKKVMKNPLHFRGPMVIYFTFDKILQKKKNSTKKFPKKKNPKKPEIFLSSFFLLYFPNYFFRQK